MRPLHALVAAAVFLSMPASARAEGDAWAALAQRIAGSDPYAQLSATLGAEPPGFVFPLPVQPVLPVLGSTWFASAKNEQPVIAHIYYAATSHTGTASESLFAQLNAAGYTRLPDPDRFAPSERSTEGRVQHMCPRDLQRPAIDVKIDRINGLPAMDVEFRLHAESTSCRDAVVEPDVIAHMPVFTAIPEVAFRSRMSPTPGVAFAAPFSTGTVRTSLAPAAAVAKFAERFVVKGWTAGPAVLTDQMITQRFTFAGTVRRLEALLVFDRRGDGVYDVLIAFTDSALDAAGR